jgi:hypothetical protein
MKVAFVIGLIVIALIVFVGIYPAIKDVLDSASTEGFSTLLAAYVGNLWWIAIILGVLAAASAWWMMQKR